MYDKLRQRGASREVADAAFAAFDPQQWEQEMRDIFGPTADDVIALEKKIGKNTKEVHEKRLNHLLENWDAVVRAMDEELPDTRQLLQMMRDTGMPTTPAELGLDQGAVHRAYLGTREIRDKYLLSSMLWDLGLLHDPEFLM